MNTFKHILKIGGIAGAVISGVIGVIDAVSSNDTSLEDRVSALEKAIERKEQK